LRKKSKRRDGNTEGRAGKSQKNKTKKKEEKKRKTEDWDENRTAPEKKSRIGKGNKTIEGPRQSGQGKQACRGARNNNGGVDKQSDLLH